MKNKGPILFVMMMVVLLVIAFATYPSQLHFDSPGVSNFGLVFTEVFYFVFFKF
jgi:hypothetical protein